MRKSLESILCHISSPSPHRTLTCFPNSTSSSPLKRQVPEVGQPPLPSDSNALSYTMFEATVTWLCSPLLPHLSPVSCPNPPQATQNHYPERPSHCGTLVAPAHNIPLQNCAQHSRLVETPPQEDSSSPTSVLPQLLSHLP